MKCPFCNAADTSVLESRTVENGDGIRRRRECAHCGKRFTTIEEVKKSFLWVIKKDGRREVFDREKIKRGIVRATQKRPISLDLIDEMVNSVEKEMLKAEKQEIPTKVIGNAVLKRLKKIDKVAWLRFASVYLEFDNLSDFKYAATNSSKKN